MSLQHGASAKKRAPPRREHSPEALEFGRRLQREMIRKGWNQSDLARAAHKYAPEIERYNVSHWVRGQHIPTPVNLNAIAKAIDIDPSVLMPEATLLEQEVPFAMSIGADGRVHMALNRTMSRETADRIVALLRQEDK